MNEAIAQGARHMRIDLGDDHPGRVGGGFGDAHLDPKGAEAMVIGGSHLNQRNVERQSP